MAACEMGGREGRHGCPLRETCDDWRCEQTTADSAERVYSVHRKGAVLLGWLPALLRWDPRTSSVGPLRTKAPLPPLRALHLLLLLLLLDVCPWIVHNTVAAVTVGLGLGCLLLLMLLLLHLLLLLLLLLLLPVRFSVDCSLLQVLCWLLPPVSLLTNTHGPGRAACCRCHGSLLGESPAGLVC